MLAFWVLAALAFCLAVYSLWPERPGDPAPVQAAEFPPVTLIVPVKGLDEGLADNLRSLAELDYPDFELIVVARSAIDIPDGVTPERARVVLAGDGDPGTAEKINNLLAAIRAARRSSEVFAFADSDGRVHRLWLRELVAGFALPGTGAASGYRWHVPDPPDFWSLLRSTWNAVIAGDFGKGAVRFAWGGATAIRRKTFEQAGVRELWRATVSDDLTLTRAVESAGLRVACIPGAFVACTDHTGGWEFLRWVRRQMIIVRVYAPRLWWMSLLGHLVYCGAHVASLAEAVRGNLFAVWALVALLGLGVLKGARRARKGRQLLPGHEWWFDRHGWVYAWWTPLATWVWMYSLAASAFTNTIEWRGNRYRLTRPSTPERRIATPPVRQL